MLTNTQVKQAKPSDKVYQLHDGLGLFLLVKPNGSKLWRVRYQIDGKRRTVSAGTYPKVSLADARKRRDQLKDQAEEVATHGKTFQEVAVEWHTKQSNLWSEKHAKTVIQRLEKNVFPVLGDRAISIITAKMVLDVLKGIENRNAYETAHRVKQVVGQIMRYGIPHEYCERDVTQDLKGALTPSRSSHLATITDPKEIGILLNAIDDNSAGGFSTIYALKILPHVFLRSQALRRSEWSEIDFDQNLWVIPKEKMKNDKLIIPLSTQVIQLLKELRAYNHPSRYLFPGINADKNLSDTALRNGLRRLGYAKEEMSIHGFRHMASTRLNELGFESDWIEKQMDHVSRDSVRATYNHAQYLDKRRDMMQKWSDYLEKLKDE